MPPNRFTGSSLPLPGVHGNGLHLAGGSTSLHLFCSAKGGFWPTAEQCVHCGMSATDKSRHQPGPARHTPPHRPRHAARRTDMWWVVRNSSIKSLGYRNGTHPLAPPTYGSIQLISRRAGWGSAALGSLCPPGFAPHYRGCSCRRFIGTLLARIKFAPRTLRMEDNAKEVKVLPPIMRTRMRSC
jgi:hypothetical protein